MGKLLIIVTLIGSLKGQLKDNLSSMNQLLWVHYWSWLPKKRYFHYDFRL